MYKRTENCPLPESALTGRSFVSLCNTSAMHEFLIDGKYMLVNLVVGHGWGDAHPGTIEDINDDGYFCEADGSERRVRYNQKYDKF